MKLSKTWAKSLYILGFVFGGIHSAVILAALLLGQEHPLFMWSFQFNIQLAVLFLIIFLVWWYGKWQYRTYFSDRKLPQWMETSECVLRLVYLCLEGEFLRRAGLGL